MLTELTSGEMRDIGGGGFWGDLGRAFAGGFVLALTVALLSIGYDA